MINTNPSVGVDEQPIEKEEEKTTHHFFSRDTLKKSHGLSVCPGKPTCGAHLVAHHLILGHVVWK